MSNYRQKLKELNEAAYAAVRTASAEKIPNTYLIQVAKSTDNMLDALPSQYLDNTKANS